MLALLPFVGINVALEANPLKAEFGLDGTYEVYRISAISGATAAVSLNILGDGTWTVTKNADGTSWVQGSTFSGTWATGPVTGSDYEVSFNNGTSWNALSSTRTNTVTANDTTLNNGGLVASSTFTVIVRKIGTTSPTCSESVTLTAEDEYSNV